MVIAEDGTPSLPPRLDREIAAMGRVTSPRVVRILDGPAIRAVGPTRHVWYREPLYAGGTLRERMRSGLREEQVLALGDALLEGAEALWEQAHIVHRDIKPENIAFLGQTSPSYWIWASRFMPISPR